MSNKYVQQMQQLQEDNRAPFIAENERLYKEIVSLKQSLRDAKVIILDGSYPDFL
jgi:hypothetical protein